MTTSFIYAPTTCLLPTLANMLNKKLDNHSFKKMEVAHPAITALQPVNKQVTLHDNTMITVPVFNVQAMIMGYINKF